MTACLTGCCGMNTCHASVSQAEASFPCCHFANQGSGKVVMDAIVMASILVIVQISLRARLGSALPERLVRVNKSEIVE